MPVYIRNYIKCKKTFASRPIHETVCGKENCPKYRQPVPAVFCSSCGSRVDVVKKYVTEDTVKPSHVVMTTGDAVFTVYIDGEYDYYLPNDRTAISTIYRETGNCVVPILTEDIADRTEKFKIQFKRAITIIEDAYGKEAVSVGYGAIQNLW